MGVAALSMPNMFAEKFMNIVPIAGCPLGTSGNILHSIGLSNFAREAMSPLFSPIFIIPIHSDSTPVSPNDISNAVFACVKVELIISGNTVVSPMNISLPSAMTNAEIKNAIQI